MYGYTPSTPLEMILLEAECIKLGIAPLSPSNTWGDFNKTLASLPPEAARAMKRKFRKLWRRSILDTEKRHTRRWARLTADIMGMGAQKPAKRMKNRRKLEVMDYIMRAHVRPVVEAAERQHQPEVKDEPGV